MKLKSLLLGSAAALAAISGAQAADLPTAEPVEYVQICDAYGAGYFFIPGGDTCLKISGYVLADVGYIASADGTFDPDGDGFGTGGFLEDDFDDFNDFGTRARGQVEFDARTSTEWGVLRSFIAIRGTVTTLPFFASDGTAGDTFNIDKAYLQLINDGGTFTAGHASSAFDFFATYAADILGLADDPTGSLNMFSYEATFGSFSAVISLEDPSSGAHGRLEGEGFFADLDGDGILDFDESFAVGYDIGGRDFPDLVGALKFTQGWGSAQLSGAVGQVADSFEGDDDDDDELGYAVQLGATVGFGMFEASLQGSYADGLISYVTVAPGAVGVSDASFDEDGDFETNSAWSIKGGVQANFTDQLFANVSAQYTSFEGSALFDADPGILIDLEEEDVDVDLWAIQGNVGYKPVAGLTILGEVEYVSTDNDFVDGGDDDGDDDILGFAARVQRNF